MMKIKSLAYTHPRESLNDLFEIFCAIRTLRIITAYIDSDSLEQVIDHVLNKFDRRSYPSIQIFIDRSSSRFVTDKIMQSNLLKSAKLLGNYASKDSG